MEGSAAAPPIDQVPNRVITEARGPLGALRQLVVPFAAGFTVLAASLLNFLNRSQYDFLRADVALVLALFASVSLVMAVFYLGQRQWGRSLLEGILVFLLVDFNSNEIYIACAAGAGVAAFTFWKRSSLLGPLGIISSFIFLTTALGFQEKWAWIRTARGAQPIQARSSAPPKPAVLHLILDEHLGLEGFSALGSEGRQFRNELEEAYLGAGFTLYGRAYSEHLHTVNAIPHALNYGKQPSADRGTGTEIGRGEHLNMLARSGYNLRIFQSNFADICSGAKFASCTTYDTFSMRPLLSAPLTVSERSKLIVLKMLVLSDMARFSIRNWNVLASVLKRNGIEASRIQLRTIALTSSISAFSTFDVLSKQLKNARLGEAYVVHLLVPHYPYVVSRDCRFMPRSKWNWRSSSSPRTKRQKAYMEQLRCVTTKVLGVVELFRASPGGRNGAIIIHGDHGSRITRIDPEHETIGKYNDEDLIAGFSTFFAVRPIDGHNGGYVGQPQPISSLLKDFAKRGFRSVPIAEPRAVRGVYLADGEQRPKGRVPLPPSWVNPSSGEHRAR